MAELDIDGPIPYADDRWNAQGRPRMGKTYTWPERALDLVSYINSAAMTAYDASESNPGLRWHFTRDEADQLLAWLDPAIAHLKKLRAEIDSLGDGTICDMCGDMFAATRSDARYCSAACRQKAHREATAKR